MAKMAFSKLDLVTCNDIEKITRQNKKGEDIIVEVKKYLPFEEKLTMISNIINQSIDDNGFYNPLKVTMFTGLEIVFAYTNLSFTDKQKNDLFKLYDQIVSSGLLNEIIDVIGIEYATIKAQVQETIESIYSYKNSVLGILETVKSDYSNLDLDATNIQEKLSDPENIGLLRDVLDKLG